MSTVGEDGGVLLRTLIEAHPVEMLGSESVGRWGADPKVQVKLVSPQSRVPLHIHPDRTFAAQHLAANSGKAEAWIVLAAPGTADGPAMCGIGLRENTSPEAFAAAVKHQDRDALVGAVHHAPIRPGDVVYIAPGVPHFISGGTFFVEVQEPADLGFLLEWKGFVENAMAASSGLGMDLALKALDARAVTRSEAIDGAFQTSSVARTNGANSEIRLFGYAVDPFFEATRLDIATVDEPTIGRYHVVIVTDGRGWVEGSFGRELVQSGDTLAIPATLEHRYRAEDGHLGLLRCFGPSPH